VNAVPNLLDLLLDCVRAIRAEVTKAIIGQREAVDFAIATVLAGQHALIEGVPGVGKTLLVRALARVLGVEFGRIQFTPDLMPADITGTNVFNLARNEFVFAPGPVFTALLLADEINRAPAKTQSALLQAMQERCVTVDRTTHALSPDFTVFATQNPVEFEGTYPLPEAQRDRFFLRIPMAPPDRDAEMELANRALGTDAPEAVVERGDLKPQVGPGGLAELRAALATLTVRPEIVGYAVDIVRATRRHESVLLGAGPRATQALVLAARTAAVLEERDFVTPDDVKRMAPHVLGHRMILRPEYEVEGVQIGEVVQSVLAEVPVPR